MACAIPGCLEFLSRLFFSQAEDGIRDHCVTGVQTCALPIYGVIFIKTTKVGLRNITPFHPTWPKKNLIGNGIKNSPRLSPAWTENPSTPISNVSKIGRASCRERV